MDAALRETVPRLIQILVCFLRPIRGQRLSFSHIILFIFYSVVAEWNCLLLVSCLDKFYIVLQVWLLRFVRVVPYL